LQFFPFYRDYMTEYRSRSAGWFEGNIRGALEEVIAREPAGSLHPVYLASDIAWIDSYLKFYALKHHRPDVMALAELFDPKTVDVARMPAGSLVVSRYGVKQEAVFSAAGFRTARQLKEPNDSVGFAVFQK
jgi:hypothetical protein